MYYRFYYSLNTFPGKNMKQTLESSVNNDKQIAFQNTILDNISDAVFTFDKNNVITSWIKSAEKLYGWKANEVIGMDFTAVLKTESDPDDLQRLFKILDETGELLVEVVHYSKENIKIIVEVHVITIKDDNGSFTGYLSVNRDITHRRQVEWESSLSLKAALKEKDVLLKELYHRTRNNMTVINSLIGLQRDSACDDSVKTVLEDIKNRILAISLVHKKLYESNNLSKIDLKSYISDLTEHLMYSYSDTDKNITLINNLENIIVLIDTAIPLGMIINEIITNSLKHAFPNKSKGEISVNLHRPEDDIIELMVSDNGIGIPKGVNINDVGTVGGQLIYALAEQQLEGTLSLNNNNGVSYSLRFRDNNYEERV